MPQRDEIEMEGRFAVFAGQDYYPNGGWHDYQASFSTTEESIEYVDIIKRTNDWWDIIDLQNKTLVEHGHKNIRDCLHCAKQSLAH